MNSDTMGLTALQTQLARASKAILAGCGFATSAWFLGLGLGPDAVEVFDLGFPVPAKIAHVVFILVAFGSGWFAWSWIRQANRLLWQLEFENNVSPKYIRHNLLGSLLSASPVAVKTISFVTLILIHMSFSSSILVEILFFEFGMSILLMTILVFLLTLPYFLIALSYRVRYFNPDNWLYRGWIMSLVAFIESCLTKDRDFDDPAENKLFIGSTNRALRRDGMRFFMNLVTVKGYERSLEKQFIESEPDYCREHGIS